MTCQPENPSRKSGVEQRSWFATGFALETRTTLLLAFPIMVGQVLQNSLGAIDTLMVGRVGVSSVAAAALASALFFMPLAFGFGLLGPFSVFVAGAFARGEDGEAARYLRCGLLVSGALGLVLALAITGLSALMVDLHQPAAVVAQARPFLLLLAWSVVPVFLFQILKQYCEALHEAWMPLAILICGVPTNISLNWIFIFGHLGAPALGLTGAGWATLLTRSLMMMTLGAFVFRQHFRAPRLRAALLGRLPHRKAYRELLGLGLPAGIQVILDVGAFTLAAIMMGWISEGALAAHQVAMAVASMTFMVPFGLSMAVAIRVSHAIESDDLTRARRCVVGSLWIAFAFMGAMAVLIFCFAPQLAALFLHDQSVIVLAAQLLVIAALFQIFDGTQIVCSAALRGFHDVKVPTLLTFTAYWLVALPTAYLLAFHFHLGAVGIWWGLLVALGSMGGLLLWRLRMKLRSYQRS